MSNYRTLSTKLVKCKISSERPSSYILYSLVHLIQILFYPSFTKTKNTTKLTVGISLSFSHFSTYMELTKKKTIRNVIA